MEETYFNDINDLVYAAVHRVLSYGVINDFVRDNVLNPDAEVANFRYVDHRMDDNQQIAALEEECDNILNPEGDYVLTVYEDGSYEFDPEDEEEDW